MNSAEQNYRLLQEIEESRRFLLLACSQNPQLLAQADTRIVELLQQDAIWQAQGKANAQHSARSKQSGISLVELIMFIVIVSIAVAGVVQVMSRVTASSADPMLRKQAIAVAESVLEEIELKDFVSASGVTNAVTQANRATEYHILSNYNGFAASGVYSASSSVAAIANLANYNLNVTVVSSDLGAAPNAVPAADAFLITVRVTDPQSNAVQISAYRTRY